MQWVNPAILRILRSAPHFLDVVGRSSSLPLVVAVGSMFAWGCGGKLGETGPVDASGREALDSSSGGDGSVDANLDGGKPDHSSSDAPTGIDGGGGSGEAGPSDSGGASGDGGTCVNIDPASYDLSCKHSMDCLTIVSGPICSGYTCILPGGAAINISGHAHYESVLSSIHPGVGPLCLGPASPPPQCLGGVCTVCNGFPSDPPACHSTAADAGPDGSACVDVDLSTYDQSCQSSTDCIGITAGVLCPGACTCGGAAVNASERLRYQGSLLQLGTSTACPCVPEGAVACVQNQCVVCDLGPNRPAGCPDGG